MSPLPEHLELPLNSFQSNFEPEEKTNNENKNLFKVKTNVQNVSILTKV